MTFLSPTFVFVFLPIVLSVYYIAPKNRRVDLLPIISSVFFVCLNISNIFSLAYYLLVMLGVIVALKCYKKKRNKSWLIGLEIFVLLISVAMVSYHLVSSGELQYIAGLLICLMAVESLCSDIRNERGRVPDTIWEGLIYVTFFPISVVGPVVRYGDFIEKLDSISFSLDRFLKGLVRFLLGFIKCVAIYAVLRFEYESILGLSGSFGLMVYIFTAALCGIAVYAFLSGYSGMARGIALMLGIDIERDFGTPLLSVAPSDYARNFLTSFSTFIKSYIVTPVCNIFGQTRFGRIVACILSGACYVFIFCRSADTALILLVPACVLAYFVMFKPRSKRMRIPTLIKPISFIITFTLMSLVWNFISYRSVLAIDDLIRGVIKQPFEYASYDVLKVILNGKNIFVPILAALIIWFVSWAFRVEESYEKESFAKAELVYKSVALFLLIILFMFCVMFLLPQFPKFVFTGFESYFI